MDQKRNAEMPTTLGPKYLTTWRGRPPHMLREDWPVWWDFLGKWGPQFDTLYYDVLLGGPFLSPEEARDPLKRMWRALNAKRADALVELKNEIWIIEVATGPGLRAVGQLLVYQSLWIEDPKILKPEKLVLVCREVDKDLISAAARYGILTFVMPL